MPYFEENPVGVMVAMEPDEMAGLQYHVWFPYARDYLPKVREGALVAVRNFASRADSPRYSILELVQVLPVHYALGSSARDAERAFPGFVTEAARSARQDWEQDTPMEESTQIRSVAIPTGVELTFEGEAPEYGDENSLPMQGEDVHILLPTLVDAIMNRGVADTGVTAIPVGSLLQTPEVGILLKRNDMLRTHFGIFGFTGAGKSNLLSTLISRLVLPEGGIRVVLFDLMGEYIPLLCDVLDGIEQGYVLSLDIPSLAGGEETRRFLWENTEPNDAAQAISRTQLLPSGLMGHRDRLSVCVQGLLANRRLRVWDPGETTPVGRQILEDLMEFTTGNLGLSKGPIIRWLHQSLDQYADVHVPLEVLHQMTTNATGFINAGSIPSFRGIQSDQQTLPVEGQATQPQGDPVTLTPTSEEALFAMQGHLNHIVPVPENRPPEGARLGLGEISRLLNASDPSLLIVQCDNDDRLRDFSSFLVNSIFHGRRRTGRSDPPVLFIYDEADEFIPGKASSGTSYVASRGAAAVLARRGRKFGMGLGISTQRVAYLDTSILAQPHTYFVSKLPRQYDRDTMANAFGITEEMMRRTLRFRVGDWLLVSYDATGLMNVPIPVRIPNANDRIREHLESHDQ